MDLWKDSVDLINAQTTDPATGFGDWFVYYPNQGTGDAVAIQALRVKRSPDEFNQAGAFEGIEITEADFTAPPPVGLGISLPVIGDVVTVDSTDYVVSAVRNPDPVSGTIVLVLNRRQRAPDA
jgi:hypothetical protein